MKKLFRKGIVAAACAATVIAGYGSAYAAGYTITDFYTMSTAVAPDYSYVPTSGKPTNRAYGVNDNGQVVGVLKGQFWDATAGRNVSKSTVIRWDLGTNGYTATNLGFPFGTSTVYNSVANGINYSGQIVGYTQFTSSKPHAWILNSDSSTVDLWSNRLSSPTIMTQTTATAINNSGVVVGYAGDSNSSGTYAYNTAFIYDSSKSSSLIRIPGATVGTGATAYSAATGINSNGLVTGYSTDANGNARAFLYDSIVGDATGFLSLGTLGGLTNSTSKGYGINLSGDVVGSSSDANGIQHAFLYTRADGTMIDLGALGGAGNTSQANAINNAGTIVGTSNSRAFMYSNGQMVDLNAMIDPSLGFSLVEATGINNLGQIVGWGTVTVNVDGTNYLQERAFALTPTPTPIPPAVFLFGSGLAGLGYFRRRRKA